MILLQPTLALFQFTPFELLIIGLLALLIFGRRLPEVGKSLGKGIVEFKKGLSGIEDNVQQASHQPPPASPAPPAANAWQQQNAALPANPYQAPASPQQAGGAAAPPMQGQPHTVGRHDAPHA